MYSLNELRILRAARSLRIATVGEMIIMELDGESERQLVFLESGHAYRIDDEDA
jgi:hypothetical protein